MEKRISKSGVITGIITLVVLLLIFNVCTFAIPFNKVDLTVHYIVYGCSEFVILAQMLLIISQLFLKGKPNQKIIGLPILYFGSLTLVAQIACTIIFYATNAFVALPIWVAILIECVIIGLGIVQVSIGFFFKKRNEEYHDNAANTKFMDEFRCRLKALDQINKNNNVGEELSDLLDIALGSDPVTNDKTLDSESELLSLLQELDEAIKDGSEEETREAINKTKIALLERNMLCKAGK